MRLCVYENRCCPGRHPLWSHIHVTSGCWSSITNVNFLLCDSDEKQWNEWLEADLWNTGCCNCSVSLWGHNMNSSLTLHTMALVLKTLHSAARRPLFWHAADTIATLRYFHPSIHFLLLILFRVEGSWNQSQQSSCGGAVHLETLHYHRDIHTISYLHSHPCLYLLFLLLE